MFFGAGEKKLKCPREIISLYSLYLPLKDCSEKLNCILYVVFCSSTAFKRSFLANTKIKKKNCQRRTSVLVCKKFFKIPEWAKELDFFFFFLIWLQIAVFIIQPTRGPFYRYPKKKKALIIFLKQIRNNLPARPCLDDLLVCCFLAGLCITSGKQSFAAENRVCEVELCLQVPSQHSQGGQSSL